MWWGIPKVGCANSTLEIWWSEKSSHSQGSQRSHVAFLTSASHSITWFCWFWVNFNQHWQKMTWTDPPKLNIAPKKLPKPSRSERIVFQTSIFAGAFATLNFGDVAVFSMETFRFGQEADGWVCTLSSNWCRLIDELRQTVAMPLWHLADGMMADVCVGGRVVVSTISLEANNWVHHKNLVTWENQPWRLTGSKSLGDVGFLLFFRVGSGDYGKPWTMNNKPLTICDDPRRIW